nr:hypothetical protein BaRGS_034611 [Batillaria attramentaria]
MGSSFTSSVDSRHSESDEVFQDAAEDFVYTKNMSPVSVTSPSSTVEESQYETGADEATSQYETGQDDEMSRENSFQSLNRDGESLDESGVSGTDRGKIKDMDSVGDDTFRRQSTQQFKSSATVWNGNKLPSTHFRQEYEESSDGGDCRLHSLDCDPSSFIFPQDYYSLREGGDHVGRAMMSLSSSMLQTPALSTISCRTWSSYDEVSTPSRADCESGRSGRNTRGNSLSGVGNVGYLPRNNSQLSTTVSMASTAELLYGADMTLMSKNKISDKPVKCLLLYQ